MNIKENYKVGGTIYKVLEKEVVEIDHDKNYFGLCNYKTNEIHILQDLCKQRKEQVLIHELTHAILNEAGFNDHEEDTANRIGIVLYQFIKDNYTD